LNLPALPVMRPQKPTNGNAESLPERYLIKGKLNSMKRLILTSACALLATGLALPVAFGDTTDVRNSIMFWAIDRNADGVIDRSEADALIEVIFDAVDLNGDGRVTREEAGFALVDAKPGADEKTAKRLAKRREDLVVKLNLTKPEGTARDEYLARSGEVFDRADADDSGGLDGVEFVGMAEAFEPLLQR
jgi:hypothetical protein